MTIIVRFDKESYKEYLALKQAVKNNKKSKKPPTFQQLLDSINTAIDNIRNNQYYGDLIPRKYIPKKTIQHYGTDKIFRVELIGYWRLLYTLIGEEANIIALILEYMEHTKYNKRFNYKKR